MSAKHISKEDRLLLKAEGICKAWNGREVLKGIDLELRAGEAVALLGANGCGKSTFLKCCNRLVEADSGIIEIDGRPILSLKARELREVRSKIGFIFQRHNLVGRLSSLSNVIHGHLGISSSPRYWLQSLAPQSIRAKALACLDSVGLAYVAGQATLTLSGGESQRVAIARALMQDPLLLFADEPVASLDPKVGHGVMSLFRDLARTRKVGLLFVSHDLDHALEYADRIVAFQHGAVVIDAPVSQVKKHELKEIYQ